MNVCQHYLHHATVAKRRGRVCEALFSSVSMSLIDLYRFAT
jgi:hypothetical protein